MNSGDAGFIIGARWVLPMDPGLPLCIDDGAVWVRGEQIEAVGPLQTIRAQAALQGLAPAVDMAREHVLIPGLVNTHTHLFQSYLRGVHDGGTLETWLRNVIWPWTEHFTADDYRDAVFLGCLENLRSGVTTVGEHAYMTHMPGSVEAVVSAISESGLRAQIAYAFADQNYPGTIQETKDGVLAKLEHLCELTAPFRDVLAPAVGPNTAWGVSRELLTLSREFARDRGLRTHMHVAETELEQAYTIRHYGQRNVEMLHDLGILGPGLQMVHCVCLSPDEIRSAASAGAAMAHCPTSNMYLASGVAPVADALDKGLLVGLATDGPGSNNSQDMLEAMKFAACLQKVALRDPTAMTAEQVLRMATLDGARLLGMDRETGSLSPGKYADMARVDLNRVHIGPVHQPASSLVYNANVNDVQDVWLRGEKILAGGAFLQFDLHRALNTARKRIGRIAPLARPWDEDRMRQEGVEPISQEGN